MYERMKDADGPIKLWKPHSPLASYAIQAAYLNGRTRALCDSWKGVWNLEAVEAAAQVNDFIHTYREKLEELPETDRTKRGSLSCTPAGLIFKIMEEFVQPGEDENGKVPDFKPLQAYYCDRWHCPFCRQRKVQKVMKKVTDLYVGREDNARMWQRSETVHHIKMRKTARIMARYRETMRNKARKYSRDCASYVTTTNINPAEEFGTLTITASLILFPGGRMPNDNQDIDRLCVKSKQNRYPGWTEKALDQFGDCFTRALYYDHKWLELDLHNLQAFRHIKGPRMFEFRRE